jgi:hypothetical protein
MIRFDLYHFIYVWIKITAFEIFLGLISYLSFWQRPSSSIEHYFILNQEFIKNILISTSSGHFLTY